MVSNKQILNFSSRNNAKNNNDPDFEDLMSSVSTVSTINSSIRSFKSSIMASKPKGVPNKSCDFIVKYLRQKNSKVLF